jgi:hypothetical protein
MKISTRKLSSIGGNTLVLTIVVTGLIGFLLSAYMGLVKSQNIATMRSQSWNASIPVIEAGIEDALTHVNLRLTNDLIGDGWVKDPVANFYVKEATIGSSRYITTISNWIVGVFTNHPVIESRGYVKAPAVIAGVRAPMPLLAVVGLPSPNERTTEAKPIARGIRVHTTTDALYSKGLVAKGTIDLNGKNIEVDSYDSRTTNFSTVDGRYDPSRRKANGSVATNSGLTNSLNVGNAKIYGKVSTGPGGSVDIGQGSVGSEAFVDAPNSKGKIETGHFTDDMNVDFNAVQLPPLPGAVFPYVNAPVQGTNYAYVLGSENYRTASFSMSSGTMVVTGRATWYVGGQFNLSGTAKIVIAPGASLTMYVAGPTTTIAGNGIVNENTSALTFQYYGLPSNTGIDFTGNGTFVGTIYAPDAAATLRGGGAAVEDFSGAAICKTVTMVGHYNFHYDEALAFIGPPKGYVVTSWNEMSAQEVAVKPTLPSP